MTIIRGYASLRRHRVSLPNTRYFLTLCTRDRRSGLTRETIASLVHAELLAIERDGHWRILGAVLIPDHLHLLIRLTETMALDRVVARFKSRTRSALIQSDLHWQGNFYEHRLRPDDTTQDVLRYLHLNPYRANLLPPSERWPWFWLGEEEAAWFTPSLDEGRPFPEWLR